jgi:hypothetical protein
VGNSSGDGLLEKLAIADRPGGTAVALPLGRHHQRGPAQLLGSGADRGISAAGAAMQHQVHQPAAAAGQQLSGDALLGPGQIAATTGHDHKRVGWSYYRAR